MPVPKKHLSLVTSLAVSKSLFWLVAELHPESKVRDVLHLVNITIRKHTVPWIWKRTSKKCIHRSEARKKQLDYSIVPYAIFSEFWATLGMSQLLVYKPCYTFESYFCPINVKVRKPNNYCHLTVQIVIYAPSWDMELFLSLDVM